MDCLLKFNFLACHQSLDRMLTGRVVNDIERERAGRPFC